MALDKITAWAKTAAVGLPALLAGLGLMPNQLGDNSPHAFGSEAVVAKPGEPEVYQYTEPEHRQMQKLLTGMLEGADRTLSWKSQLDRHIRKQISVFYKHFASDKVGVARELALLFAGLPAQESRLNDEAFNKKTGATGPFQITKVAMLGLLPTLKNITGQKYSERNISEAMRELNSFEISSKLALVHLLKVIIKSRMFADLIDLRVALNMSDQSFNQFAALVILNAYNTGQGAVSKSLHGFLLTVTGLKENESRKVALSGKRSINYSIEHATLSKLRKMNALEIFYVFSQMARKNKWHATYGREASEYALKILAARLYMADRNILPLHGGFAGLSPSDFRSPKKNKV